MTKNVMVAFVIGSVAWLSSARAEVVKTCQLTEGASNTVQVIRDNPILDTHVYTSRYAGKSRYFFTDEERSRGGPVAVICTGKKERALVVYGEFTSSYLQGFALVYNRSANRIERLDFAEKGPPEWLYLSETEAIVVARTDGAGENGGKPYAAYRYKKGGNAEPVVEGVDVPVPLTGYQAFRLTERALLGTPWRSNKEKSR